MRCAVPYCTPTIRRRDENDVVRCWCCRSMYFVIIHDAVCCLFLQASGFEKDMTIEAAEEFFKDAGKPCYVKIIRTGRKPDEKRVGELLVVFDRKFSCRAVGVLKMLCTSVDVGCVMLLEMDFTNEFVPAFLYRLYFSV